MDKAQQEFYMKIALKEAEKCFATGDVPVGAILVKNDVILATGRNRREEKGDATAHAEVEAIRSACEKLGTWRLTDCQLFVTLEPCAMCSGSIINSKIYSVYYGAWEEKTGCCGSVLNLFEEGLGHRPRIYGGILQAECEALLQRFFQSLRD